MEEKRTAKIIPVLFSMNWQHRPEHLKIKHKKDISRYSEEVIQTTGPLNSTHYLTHMGAGTDCFHSSFYDFQQRPLLMYLSGRQSKQMSISFMCKTNVK